MTLQHGGSICLLCVAASWHKRSQILQKHSLALRLVCLSWLHIWGSNSTCCVCQRPGISHLTLQKHYLALRLSLLPVACLCCRWQFTGRSGFPPAPSQLSGYGVKDRLSSRWQEVHQVGFEHDVFPECVCQQRVVHALQSYLPQGGGVQTVVGMAVCQE
jgi:hypothetical protein